MAKVPLSVLQRQALLEFIKRAAARAQAEDELKTSSAERKAALEADRVKTLQEIERVFQTAKTSVDTKMTEMRERIAAQAETDQAAARQEFDRLKHQTSYTYTTDREKTLAEFKENRWSLATIYDSDKKVADENLVRARELAAAGEQKVANFVEEGRNLIRKWQLGDADPETQPCDVVAEDPFDALQTCIDDAAERLASLKAFTLPAYLKSMRFPLYWIMGWVLVSAPAFLIPQWYIWLAVTTVGVILSALFTHRRLKRVAHNAISEMFRPICQAGVDVQELRRQCDERAKQTQREERAAAKEKYDTTLADMTQTCKSTVHAMTHTRNEIIKKARTELQGRSKDIASRTASELEKAEASYTSFVARITTRHDNDLQEATKRFAQERAALEHWYAEKWAELTAAWKRASDAFREVIQRVDRENRQLFPPWETTDWEAWQPPRTVPLGIRFGELGVRMERIPHGKPSTPDLPSVQLDGATFPALLPFPNTGSLLLKAAEEGRGRAVQLIQALMMRFLTAIPPGKARLTIFDPVGRGENFAAFMHLADFDELLINTRIWTETTHFEQRLVDLTDHMENVIQKYLRNQFETLEDYNAQAGEVAEPYRILAVANFPTNFSPSAARRLVSLAASGARCGVYTLISVDTKQQLPQGFDLGDLEEACLTLDWRDQRFHWIDPDFCAFPLRLEEPPSDQVSTRVLHKVGERAKEASRVEVPFDGVAPPRKDWWTGSTRGGIAVPLGRAGAVKLQLMDLGRGTAQHVLIAGKTGSGKSTLLHVLITQMALMYSPDEIELYLVDFKKGVEFKTYAAHRLPHARVVAVESEREFGLSVLQKLDAELKRRGEIFRNLGIADLPSYRQFPDQPPMPRIMLIVDEFQEFFVEDDRIGQDSSLLLDRLVRQGRAFGIHILMGSQTLGGAYSLARSTIDQMAVRVALQCSETDAHFILSKDNSAARLLTRPGEAIYNPANGNPENNNFFQIVWLEDDRRDEILKDVVRLAEERHYVPAAPQIVFEGTAPSDLLRNPEITRWLGNGAAPLALPVPNAWLGEAIAIKDPTAAVFSRQSGANVLIVGQSPDTAFNLMVSSLVSLAVQNPAAEADALPTVSLVVGATLDDKSDEVFHELPGLFAGHLQTATSRDAPALLTRLTEEMQRRQTAPSNRPLFLFLYGMQRLRDLRQEENFGFSRRDDDKPASPGEQFVALLREGPNVGIFTVVWCDTVNNLNRVIERQTLREFEMRILFQMNAGDSSHLIDNPLASKLGMHRALFYSDDQGRLEKFRPYALPSVAALADISARLRGARVGV